MNAWLLIVQLTTGLVTVQNLPSDAECERLGFATGVQFTGTYQKHRCIQYIDRFAGNYITAN
jgi:hypothetical protein